MISKKISVLIISIILLLIAAWSPWITNSYSEKVVSERFITEWYGVMDGCGFNCTGCGIKKSQRALFGVNVKIEYACGMKIGDQGNETKTVFVSFLGTLHDGIGKEPIHFEVLKDRILRQVGSDLEPSVIPHLQDRSLSHECEEQTGYSVEEYQDGWEKTFMRENKLSESQFDNYLSVSNVSFQPIGNTCNLVARYTIKKDWLSVNRVDSMTLGVPPAISPNNLPIESDLLTNGRQGVSAINLHDPLSFESRDDALNYFIKTYDLSSTNAQIQREDFQYFWNKESAEKGDYSFAGEGGEAYIIVFGTIDSRQNKCYQGEVSLVTKETTYRDTPCEIN